MHLRLLSLPLLLSVLTPVFSSPDQEVIMNPAIQDPTTYTTLPTLADLLTIEPSASIFYSYARELTLSSMFSELDTRVTLLVPTNKAVMALARKPHQGPEPIDGGSIEITEEEFDKMSKSNVERWVSAHIIPEYPTSLTSSPHPTLLEGKYVSFTPIPKNDGKGPEWTRVTLDNGAKILQKMQASNGDIYLIDGVISSS